MKKGRSNYSFQINCSPEEINTLIQSYLTNDKYKVETKNGETYYRFSDPMLGYRGFNYSINNNYKPAFKAKKSIIKKSQHQ